MTYGVADNVSLKMDIYYPQTAAGALPVVMYVHGGGWTGGDKTAGAGANEIPEMIKRGYLVVSVNYRLAPQYKFPAMIEDVKCAVRYLRATASDYGLDPDKIGVWGGSAGGHLVALLGTADASAGFEGSSGYLDQSSRVRAVVDFFGPAELNIMFRGHQVDVMENAFGVTDSESQVLKVKFLAFIINKVFRTGCSQCYHLHLEFCLLLYALLLQNNQYNFSYSLYPQP